MLKNIDECKSSIEIWKKSNEHKVHNADSYLQRKIESLRPQHEAAMHLEIAILNVVAEGASKEVLDMSLKSESGVKSKSSKSFVVFRGFYGARQCVKCVEYFRDCFVNGIVQSESLRKMSSKCQQKETGLQMWFSFLKTLLRHVATPSSKIFAGGALVFEETWHVELVLLLALVPVTETHIDATVKEFEMMNQDLKKTSSSTLERMSIRFGQSKPKDNLSEKMTQVRALYNAIELTKEFEAFLQNFFEDPRFHSSRENFRVPNFQGQLLKCFDPVVAPIYRDRAKQIAERIGKISLKSCEKTLSDDGNHQIYAELDPLFHDVLDLIKLHLSMDPDCRCSAASRAHDDSFHHIGTFGKLHLYAKILTNRISNISKSDDRIDRLLLIYNSATQSVKYCNAANDIVQDTLEDQSDSFEVVRLVSDSRMRS